MRFFSGLFIVLMIQFAICRVEAFGQNWMPGYEFRRKITFDKTKIEGGTSTSGPLQEVDVSDFPVLIEMQDEAFKYHEAPSCSGLADPQGRNIAFATTAAPTVKLNFQIESYDPVEGKYRCWVKIPSLAAVKTSTPATSVYFYYGGSALHNNDSPAGLNTWTSAYSKVWHMNGEDQGLTGHGFTAQDKVPGKLGTAFRLDGLSQYLHSAGDTSHTFSVAAWVRWNGGTSSQTIITTDSIGTGKSGWRLGISAQGRIEMATYKSSGIFWSSSSIYALTPGVWTHIACSFSITGTSSSAISVYLNGASAGGAGGGSIRFSPGGYLSVGRNKDGSQYFSGEIDEVRIYSASKPIYWFINEYRNQHDPTSFYNIGPEEANASWATFTGAASNSWTAAANWLNGIKPVSGSKVRIKAGKTARLNGADAAFDQLVLESGASLSSEANLKLNCMALLGSGAELIIEPGKKLTVGGDQFRVAGEGKVHTSILEINASNFSSVIELLADVEVAKELRLVRGKLNSNGKLWLLASRQEAAAVSAVSNPSEAGIAGDVNVQSFVDGSFPQPSSGRGWRLCSSPVKNTNSQYHLLNIKTSVFVTGKGGTDKGFDPSPNNGATIYTHDQSLSGMLKDKFIPIPDLSATIPVGRGFYLFSRGSRLVENAYRDQIQNSPFSNPEPYLINFKGELHVGNLTVDVYNRNSGEEGDGYNLLGNPYASPIRWGSLIKEHMGPFIWMFDPLNGTYMVSDDPQTVIPAGAGFFVKVLDGFSSGTLTFTENCKATE